MPTIPTPPTTLSALVRLGLADLAAVEALDKYVVDMDVYHGQVEEANDALCHVCFAGAVMARTHNIPVTNVVGPNDFDEQWMHLFSSLNQVRTGYIRMALVKVLWAHDLDAQYETVWLKAIDLLDNAGFPSWIPITSYDSSPTDFRKDMEHLADRLESAGL